VLAAVEPYAGRIEYEYTDLSPALVAQGRARFGQYGFARFRELDAAAAVEAHERSQYDVIIAGNVLHATESMAGTLGRIKERLKAGGVLIAGEMVEASSYATLTFGLLEGWWRFEDGERRRHAPLLSAADWRQVLEEAGYRGGVYRLREDLPAALVVGESDGWIREAAVVETASKISVSVTRQPVGDAGEIGKRLLEVVAEALKVQPEELSLETPVGEYGVDSIVAVELIEHINQAFGAQLRSTDLFNYATLSGVAAQLATGGEMQEAPAPERVKAAAEDVAIIGMSGRFAGAENLREYWRNLERGQVTVTEVPASRWAMDAYYDASPGVAGKSVAGKRWRMPVTRPSS
jgi:acyl carrier protein